MRFADVPGLDGIKSKLVRSAQSGKIAHAQLFQGPEGALNLPLALAFTSFLHCTQRGKDDSCGTCPACVKSAKFIHPDTHFVFPIGNVKGDRDEDQYKADSLKSWRAFLLEQPFGNLSDWVASYGGEDKQVNISREVSREIVRSLSLKPFESPVKVMIIWLPEFMHASSANAILKILEEPPPSTFFLLVSNNPEKLLPTILSRTQEVTVPMLDDRDLESHIKGVGKLTDSRRMSIVTEAEGNLRLALQLIETEEDDHHARLAGWLRACYARKYEELVNMAQEFHEMDRLQQQSLLSYALIMIRETLLAHAGAEELLRSRNGEQKFVHDFGKVMNLKSIERATQLLTEAGLHLERNGSAKMIFLDLSLQLSRTMSQ